MTRAELEKQLADLHYKIADIHLELAAEAAGDGQPARPVAASPSAAPATFSDGIPVEEPPVWEEFEEPRKAPTNSKEDAVLGECPIHFKPWSVKEGGISKNGKPYGAFWKCSGKNDDGSYCNKKPTPGWVKTHNPEKALTAAA